MKMTDVLPPEIRDLAASGGWAAAGLMLLRWAWLRVSKDTLTLQADASDRAAFKRLETRVNLMERRLFALENIRNRLFGFITKCMAYISQCQCDGVQPSKVDLHGEYEQLLYELSRHFNDATEDHDGKESD